MTSTLPPVSTFLKVLLRSSSRLLRRRVAFMAVCVVLWCGAVWGQQVEPDEVVVTEPAVENAGTQDAVNPDQKTVAPVKEAAGKITLPLPLRDRDGRPLRPIGFYLSQITRLLPKNFRPISIEELQAALGNESERFSESAPARLVSGFYDVRLDDQMLVSNRSELLIEHHVGQTVHRPLGRVNLAITDPAGVLRTPLTSGLPDLPRLEVDHNGELIAVVPKSPTPDQEAPAEDDSATNDSNGIESAEDWTTTDVRFGWTLQSQAAGDTRRFELRLPRTAQTRLVISTPSTMMLETRQGVLVERPGPPPDADVETRTGDIRWYVLEAGGLNRLEIFAKRRAEGDSNQPIIVRRDSKQYEVDLSGVSWIHRMTIELPRQRQKLQLRASQGTVSTVRVNAIEGQYQIFRQPGGDSLIDIDLPSGMVRGGPFGPPRDSNPSRSTIELVTLTVEGNSNWELADGKCDLPSVTLAEPNVYWTEASTQSMVAVFDPLEVAQWSLPAQWRQSVKAPTRAGETLLIAEGPPPGQQQSQSSWSSLELVEKEERIINEVWTRLRVKQTPSRLVRAASRVRWRLLQNYQSPFRLDLNPDWTVDSVTVVGSGRRVSTPVGTRELVVWPTPSESAQATFEIEVVTQQSLPRNPNRLQIGAPWIVRPHQKAAPHVISIEPPPLRRWNGNSVMIPGRLESSSLDEAAFAFFQPTAETLLLRSPTGQVPTVTLEPVDVTFGVSLRHFIEMEGEDVSETIVVRAETTQPIPSLSVMTGNTRSNEFNWSLRRTDKSATVSLPSSSVERMTDDPLGTYVIQLEGRDLRQYELVGQRYFSAGNELVLALPSVRRARSQTAESLVNSSWEVTDIPFGVQLVPGIKSNVASQLPGEFPQHLRYDPVQRPEIKLRRAQTDSAACLIWDQRFEVIANSRSEDLFHLVADVSTRRPIHVTFDDELEIVSITRNSVAYEPGRAVAGELWIQPERQSDRVAIVLRRRHSNRDWLRRCLVPRVRIDGHVVRNRNSFQAGAGTLVLYQRVMEWDAAEDSALAGQTKASSLPTGTDNGAAGSAPSTELILIPRDIVIGLGWLLAIMMFGVAWTASRWFPIGIHGVFVLVVVAISGAIIWWPWQLAIVGWIAVPLAAGGLLHVVMRKPLAEQPKSPTKANSNQPDDTRSQRGSRDPSVDFSVSIPLSTILLAITLVVLASGMLMAQPPLEDSRRDPVMTAASRRDPIELLVPLGKDHIPVGDKVYLSQTDYESVRSVMDPDRPVDVRFMSAQYRVVLSPPDETTESINAEIQADYHLQLERQSTRIRLPIPAESLKRIEMLSDGDTQILRDNVDERGMVIATIPLSRQIRLRLTYLPTVSTTPVNLADPGTRDSGGDASGAPQADEVSVGAVPSSSLRLNNSAESTATTKIQLGIPAIHSASLIVESPPEIVVESLGDPLGQSQFRSELGRYEADLGPIKELAITCRVVSLPEQNRQQRIRRAYRIAAGIESTIVECEIDPEERMTVGDTIQLTILGGPPTSVTSSGWSVVTPDNGNLAERTPPANAGVSNGVVRFIKRTDANTPIRLLWRIRSDLNDPTSTSDSRVTPIPEVFLSASSRSTPTLFAIQSASDVQISELAKGALPATEDDFLAAWNGYPGVIDRVFVSENNFPSFVLLQDKYPPPAITLDHQLHVAQSKMELTVKGKVVDLRPGIQRLAVSIPDRFRLVACRVNNTVVTSMTPLPPIPGSGRSGMQLTLGDNRIEGTTSIELVGESMEPIRGQTELPRFKLLAEGQVSQTYRITRDRSLDVEVIEPPSSGPDDASVGQESVLWKAAELTQADLLAGRIPVATSNTSQQTKIRVSRRTIGAVFRCKQFSLMRYSDGQWFCDTLLELPANKLPDFVDVEIPARWASNLAVYPPGIWGRRESSDSLVTVVRVGLSDNDGESKPSSQSVRRVQITGSLDNRDQSRVSVPAIKVLGGTPRNDINHVIAVPDRLTTESIQWQREAVRSLKLDKSVFAPFEVPIDSPERYSLYTTIESNWSIELEPLSQPTIEPVALACDARVFLDGDRALVFQRFDILPETENEVWLALPSRSTCIGIWSAGREVDLRDLRSAAKHDDRNPRGETSPIKVRVPLAYSRLPQSLEVLVEVPVISRRITDYLSELLGVPTQELWVAFYQVPLGDQSRRLTLDKPDGSEGPDGGNTVAEKSPSQLQNERAFSLAQSVVTAIDRSRDMLAERGDEEIKRWLLPWVTRYQEIAGRNGHLFLIPNAQTQADEKSIAESGSSLPVEAAAITDVDLATQKRWEMYDRRLLELAGRFLQADPDMPQPLFLQSRFSDYEIVSMTRLDSFAEPPVLVQTFTPRKSLQRILVNAITLFTFGLAIILMWPFRGRFQNWIHAPALWLFVVGLLGVFLIPPPVAVMLMIVAVTVPLINRTKGRSAATGL